MQNNFAKILDDEIEELIHTKNGLIADTNDLSTQKRELQVEIWELEIKSANIVSNEKARLAEINKDFIAEIEGRNGAVTQKEDCFFVLLAQLVVNINKTAALWGLLGENISTLGEFQSNLISEIEKYKNFNKDAISRLHEVENVEIEIDKIYGEAKIMQEKIVASQKTLEEIKILEWETKQHREIVEKEKEYVLLQRQRLGEEAGRIENQWKALENTKNYLWQSQSSK